MIFYNVKKYFLKTRIQLFGIYNYDRTNLKKGKSSKLTYNTIKIEIN